MTFRPAESTMSAESNRCNVNTYGYLTSQPMSGGHSDATTGHASHGHQLAVANVAHDPTSYGAMMSSFSSLAVGRGGNPYPGFVTGHDGPYPILGYAPTPLPIGMIQNPVDGSYNAAAAYHGQYNHNVPGAYYPLGAMPFTPGRGPATYTDRSDNQHDVPALQNRRGSYSTTESAPATPFFRPVSDRSRGPRVTVVDRSNYTTPSPQQQLDVSITVGNKEHQPIDAAMEQLLQREPAIPRAVPAVWTPAQHQKSLDQCLENRIVGNRNVYIRGLHPTTDDELLLKYAERFGEVETSKAIIDTSTGACKG
jgi:hypothetical protein